MITKDKITEIFCILDEFSKNFDAEMQNHSLLNTFFCSLTNLFAMSLANELHPVPLWAEHTTTIL